MRCGKGQLHIESKLFFNLLERHTIEKETLVWTDRDQRTETEEILLGKDKMWTSFEVTKNQISPKLGHQKRDPMNERLEGLVPYACL